MFRSVCSDLIVLISICTQLQVIIGLGVSKVIKSENPEFKEGVYIWGLTGWEEYSMILKTDGHFKIKYTDVPLSYYAGILGTQEFSIY